MPVSALHLLPAVRKETLYRFSPSACLHLPVGSHSSSDRLSPCTSQVPSSAELPPTHTHLSARDCSSSMTRAYSRYFTASLTDNQVQFCPLKPSNTSFCLPLLLSPHARPNTFTLCSRSVQGSFQKGELSGKLPWHQQPRASGSDSGDSGPEHAHSVHRSGFCSMPLWICGKGGHSNRVLARSQRLPPSLPTELVHGISSLVFLAL